MATTTALQLCTFRVGPLHLGVDVTEVQEVLRYQETTFVPLAPEVVTGLINLRGQIVTAIDLRRRLELPPLPDDQHPMNVVVRRYEDAVCLLVDAIGDVVEPDDTTFEPPPETVTGLARELIRGAYKLDEGLLLLLDTERALEIGAV